MPLSDLYLSCKMVLIKTSESKASFVCHRWCIHTCTCLCIGIRALFCLGKGGSQSLSQSCQKLPQFLQSNPHCSTNEGDRILTQAACIRSENNALHLNPRGEYS